MTDFRFASQLDEMSERELESAMQYGFITSSAVHPDRTVTSYMSETYIVSSNNHGDELQAILTCVELTGVVRPYGTVYQLTGDDLKRAAKMLASLWKMRRFVNVDIEEMLHDIGATKLREEAEHEEKKQRIREERRRAQESAAAEMPALELPTAGDEDNTDDFGN